jgi:HAMP domain-containing protein
VVKPETESHDPYAPLLSAYDSGQISHQESQNTTESEIKERFSETATDLAVKPKSRRLGLRSKMFGLFLIVPTILITSAVLLLIWQLNSLSEEITVDGMERVRALAEDIIGEKSRAVASQVRLFLLSHPNVGKRNFQTNETFNKIAVQKVGKTGYTALYELPDAADVWRTWAHANPKIIGIDMSNLRKPLGENFPGFWKIYTGVKKGTESQGYYTWQDADGEFRDKFMVCTPVKGTPYIIAATTYLDEFTEPIEDIQRRAQEITNRSEFFFLVILGSMLLIIGLTVMIYSQRLSGKIQAIRDLAEKISLGELDAEVDITSKDEIGDLVEAISRMQASIKLSMDRLRRTRST